MSNALCASCSPNLWSGLILPGAGTNRAITGAHRYYDGGAYPLQFQYQDQFDAAAFGGTILVTPGALTPQTVASNAARTVTRANWLVAQFTSDNDQTTAGRFAAIIDWGDGQRSEGIVTGGGGQFAVHAPQHAYSQPGQYETTVWLQSGYGARQTVEILSSMTVAEAAAGPAGGLDIVDYELLDWYESASGGGPGDPPPGPMKAAGYTLSDVDVVRGPGDMWRYTDTKDVFHGYGRRRDRRGDRRDGDNRKIIYRDWVSGNSTMSDGGDLPGQPAISQDTRILWGDGQLDSVAGDDPDVLFSDPFPAITRMSGRHVYDNDTFGGSGNASAPLQLTGRVYGVDIPRDLDIADGAIDVTESQTLIYGFEDEALSSVLALAFTKQEFGEQDATATAIWGDGTSSEPPVVVNADNTLSVALDHQYSEEGAYELSIIIRSAGGVARVVKTNVMIMNRDLAFTDIEPFAAAANQWTGDVPLARIEASAWHPPWEGLAGDARDAARDAFRPEDMFRAPIDWGDGTTTAGTFRVEDDDSLVILGNHTYTAAADPYPIYVKFIDQSSFPAQFATAATVVDGWAFDVRHRTNGFNDGYQDPIGTAKILVNTGGIKLAHPLDFDISPGTAVGRDPALIYNSNTAHVRPILEGRIATASDGALAEAPASTAIQLTWNDRTAQPWRSYDSSNRAPGDTVLAGDATGPRCDDRPGQESDRPFAAGNR